MKNILRQIFLIATILAVFPASVFADSVPDPATLYEKGEYSKAAETYLQLDKSEGYSASLYFNLANCYAETGDYAHAVLYYSRANRLDPSNKVIKNNLDFILSKVEDSNRAELKGKKTSVSPEHETFFQTAHKLIARDVLSDTWAIFSAVAFVLFICCVAVYLFCSNVVLRKTGFFGGFCLMIMSLVFILFAFMAASDADSHDRGVMMAYKTELLVEPSSDSKAASSAICQGTCLHIMAEETDVQGMPTWYKVRLNSNFEGWVRASDIEVI